MRRPVSFVVFKKMGVAGMNKMPQFACAVLASLLITGVALAQEEAPKGVKVTITGVNISLLGTYGEGEEAGEDIADLNALKVTSATDAAGKAIDGLEGKVLAYVPTTSAQALIKGKENAGKTVSVEGTLYQDAGVIRVSSFEVSTTAPVDIDLGFEQAPITSMSGQQLL
jgi:hypothetical protein